MEGFRRLAARAGAAFALWGLAAAAPIGQAPAAGHASTPRVIDTGAYTPFVENMDRSLVFYRDVFSMEVPTMPESG